MNGFNKRRQRKIEDIRQAALELFLAHGISKVAVKEIATRAGVSPVSIYNYFGSKEGLVRDVVKDYLDRAVERYRAILEGDMSFEAKLEAIIFDKKNLMRSASTEFMQAVCSADPEINAYFNRIYSRMRQNLSMFLEQGQAEGYVNPRLSPEIVMLYFDVLKAGITANKELFGSPGKNEEMLAQFTEIYLHGLSGVGNKNLG